MTKIVLGNITMDVSQSDLPFYIRAGYTEVVEKPVKKAGS